ncbi:uncharacterized protein LOC135834602 [Planococcus citri]|uniref:uncharacterized protein LOC135834602 n=1 Tax=Planococcus citri TaxID=170843 RepID=UPI0031F9F3D8
MVLKKVCCTSLRMGSLVLLYIHLINCVCSSVLSVLVSAVGNPTVDKFISENAALFYSDLFLSIVGGLIILATIVSITKKTPSNSLLIATMSFLILGVIYCVYAMVLVNLNDPFKKLYQEIVYENAQTLIENPKGRERYVKYMDGLYGSVLSSIYLSLLCEIAFILYSVLVFYSYMVEIKENIANDVRFGKNNSEEGYSRVAPPYTSQYDTQLTQRPQYSVNV